MNQDVIESMVAQMTEKTVEQRELEYQSSVWIALVSTMASKGDSVRINTVMDRADTILAGYKLRFRPTTGGMQ